MTSSGWKKTQGGVMTRYRVNPSFDGGVRVPIRLGVKVFPAKSRDPGTACRPASRYGTRREGRPVRTGTPLTSLTSRQRASSPARRLSPGAAQLPTHYRAVEVMRLRQSRGDVGMRSFVWPALLEAFVCEGRNGRFVSAGSEGWDPREAKLWGSKFKKNQIMLFRIWFG